MGFNSGFKGLTDKHYSHTHKHTHTHTHSVSLSLSLSLSFLCSCQSPWARGLMIAAVWRILQKHTCLIALLVVVLFERLRWLPKRPLTCLPGIITITSSLVLYLYPHPKLPPPVGLTTKRERTVIRQISSNCHRNEQIKRDICTNILRAGLVPNPWLPSVCAV